MSTCQQTAASLPAQDNSSHPSALTGNGGERHKLWFLVKAQLNTQVREKSTQRRPCRLQSHHALL